ncbi:unnamed protein product [Brachionus calyciflorus]|uniref:Uncharacterized protein n=1 Tax=Brachionus calyciflorus TaxID=104777 RepID=A0A814R3I5_9BILA|nr:unnamed protein product [Brachionus calyciflorus]
MNGSPELQHDLNILTEWANLWSTELNLAKCKAMYLGGNKLKNEYYVTGSDEAHALSETIEEKDLGLTVTNNLKCSFKGE